MSSKIYIHEYINIIGANRANYFRHMTTDWGRHSAERHQKCFGVWGTLGSTGQWPQVVNLWEYDDWDSLAASFAHETGTDTMQDKALETWWLTAQSYRSGGFDRVLIAAPCSPPIEQLCAEGTVVGAKVFLHEIVSIKPGFAQDYLELVSKHWREPARELGLQLVGAFRTAMCNDSEVVLIWAMQEWSDWARASKAQGSQPFQIWRAKTEDIVLDWTGHLMCSAPASPLKTGVQP
ncbi:hypothetical protein J1C56_28025 [Aminobacter anthyllidis]|uniref:NIPSNAP family containing protein n=1 Tax=Aminobacter anthyllidis TaxID=1035067 RepID=A0A9X1D8Z0_9HYPH|nr:hypothetical protein [Aminobacter anthyllidis]MBT1159423.1 hypothetical protein [Aminobacter anthyllidis]